MWYYKCNCETDNKDIVGWIYYVCTERQGEYMN